MYTVASQDVLCIWEVSDVAMATRLNFFFSLRLFGAWLFVNITLNQIHKLSLYWYLGSKFKMDII